MSNGPPWDITASDDHGELTTPATGAGIVRRLTVVLLLTAAALDLTRCGLVIAVARHPAPTAGLMATGLAAAALTARTARGCQLGQRWAAWAALLIGAASAPQAAASGFRGPYIVPDTATAALGVLLAITILATAARAGRRDRTPDAVRPVCGIRNGLGVGAVVAGRAEQAVERRLAVIGLSGRLDDFDTLLRSRMLDWFAR